MIYIVKKVDSKELSTITQLKSAIREEVTLINNDKALLSSVVIRLEDRLAACINVNGKHLDDN